MKFRKKPVVVEAVQYKGPICFPKGEYPILPDGIVLEVYDQSFDQYPIIHTLEGNFIVRPEDWIVTGVEGERYAVKPDIFEKIYEPVV